MSLLLQAYLNRIGAFDDTLQAFNLVAASDAMAAAVASRPGSGLLAGLGDEVLAGRAEAVLGEELSAAASKIPGWLRLAVPVEDAPWGWVLPQICGCPRRWWSTCNVTTSSSPYADAGWYWTPREEGTVRPEWDRPDWALLLIAQAEANMLRGLDKLPPGCVARAKFRDAAYIEQTPGASLSQWSKLDPAKSGQFKFLGDPVPGGWFADCVTPTEWQHTYAAGA